MHDFIQSYKKSALTRGRKGRCDRHPSFSTVEKVTNIYWVLGIVQSTLYVRYHLALKTTLTWLLWPAFYKWEKCDREIKSLAQSHVDKCVGSPGIPLRSSEAEPGCIALVWSLCHCLMMSHLSCPSSTSNVGDVCPHPVSVPLAGPGGPWGQYYHYISVPGTVPGMKTLNKCLLDK